jgi:hypothetical protein
VAIPWAGFELPPGSRLVIATCTAPNALCLVADMQAWTLASNSGVGRAYAERGVRVFVAKPRSGFAGLRLWRQLARGAAAGGDKAVYSA